MLQQQFNRVGKVETGSVALPAIMRSGAGGPERIQTGSMPEAKQHITSVQMHQGHMPPLVRQTHSELWWNVSASALYSKNLDMQRLGLAW